MFQLAIQRQRAETLRLQQRHQLAALVFGVAKRQRADGAKVVQQQRHGGQAVGAGHLVKALLDQVLGMLRFDLDGLRLAHELVGDAGNSFGVGGRKQEGLALFGALFHHGHNVVQKPHIQHAVGFVQHQGVERFQRQKFARQMVHDAPWRANDDVRAVF